MNFPLLRRLTLAVKDPVPFLEAIVAPKLPSFSFSRGHCEGPVSNKTYNGSRTKFDNVSRLALSSVYMTDKHTLVLLKLLCQIFFGIRHASVHMDHVSTLFTSYGQGPIEHWRYLESLDVRHFVLDSPRLFHWGDSISNTVHVLETNLMFRRVVSGVRLTNKPIFRRKSSHLQPCRSAIVRLSMLA